MLHSHHLDGFQFFSGLLALVAGPIIIVTGMLSILLRHGLKSSIDFAGGALVEIALQQPVPVQEVRSIVSNAGFGDAEITRFG